MTFIIIGNPQLSRSDYSLLITRGSTDRIILVLLGKNLLIVANQNNCLILLIFFERGRRGCDHMVVGFTTTYAFGAYHN